MRSASEELEQIKKEVRQVMDGSYEMSRGDFDRLCALVMRLIDMVPPLTIVDHD